jgi:hypothetical protein
VTAKPVKVAWVSDSSELRNDVAKVGTAMDSAAGQAQAAGAKIDGAFDSTAQHADDVASKGSQAAGALSGLGDLVGGKFGTAMMTGGVAMQAFADAGDLVNVVTDSAIVRKIKDTAVTVGQTAATIAHKVASKAVAAATKAWTATQWLLNAALSANPLGLVVIAVAALVAAVIIAYKKSDTFREIVTKAFSAVSAVASDALKLFTSVVDFIGGVPGKISALGEKFKSAGKGVMDKIIEGIKGSAGFITSIGSSIAHAAGDLLNKAIDAINAALEFKIAIPGAPDITINPPNIPHVALANGGIVTRPTFALIGEAGPEAVIPLGRSGPSTLRVHLTADALDQLTRGRRVSGDLDAFTAHGGRRAG